MFGEATSNDDGTNGDNDVLDTKALAVSDINADVDDNDDYMSEIFVASSEHVRPGISSGYSYKRRLKIDKLECDKCVVRNSAPKRAKLEEDMRQKGLSQPISELSKGFEILSKMGFKPGMSIGKKKGDDGGERIKVPLPISIKLSRSGLGRDAEQAEKIQKVIEYRRKMFAAAEKSRIELLNDFNLRKLNQQKLRNLSNDLRQSRKACESLDIDSNRQSPVQSHFWPSIKVESDEDEDETELQGFTIKYANGRKAVVEKHFEDLTEDELDFCLSDLTKYLRRNYFYCVWCGTKYESESDLSENCPGSARTDHADNGNDDNI